MRRVGKGGSVSQRVSILVVDDEKGCLQAFRRSFQRAFVDDDFPLECAADGAEALEKLAIAPVDLVITDLQMPRMDGMELLGKINRCYPEIFVVLMSGYGTVENAVGAMKAGAYDFILKPFDFERIRLLINIIAEHKKLLLNTIEPTTERRKKFRFENIVGQNSQLFKIYRTIADVADSTATVLITGESGTGKELIAEALHYCSRRREKSLIKVNCSAFTETLINSELFGHEKGAFTGADRQKVGLFEAADQGTIFLDEIGDITVATQLSLLRVLESSTFQRVGSTKTIKVDSRVICATNRDLAQAVEEGTFRRDLFYRINVVPIHIPSLRERKSDIPLLAYHFLRKFCAIGNKPVPRLSGSALKALHQYDWPGNVRELANVMENVALFCKAKEVRLQDLSQTVTSQAGKEEAFSLELTSMSLPKAEAALIRRVLGEADWNLKQAAAKLGIARGTLYSKMQKYGIEKPQV